MNTSTKVILSVLASFVILGVGVAGVLFSAYTSNHDYGNRAESQIVAEYQRAQNVLSNASTTVMDVASVSERYADDIKEVVQMSMTGRSEYGENATVAFLQEQNINIDSSMYEQINLAIMSGREDFQNAQNRVIDVRRSYKTKLGSLWDGFWLKTAGYPKIDLEDYEIIVDQSTIDKFESGVDSGFLAE